MDNNEQKLSIQDKIDYLERNGLWDQDVNEDPETYELKPDQIDYLDKKLSSKIKTWIANIVGYNFYENLIKKNINSILTFPSIASMKS